MSVTIILSKPQLGSNIGAVARVMKNFSLEDLRIVNPRDGWPNPDALTMSAGAKDVVNNAKIYNSIEESLEGIDFLISISARPRGMNKEVIEISNINDYLEKNPVGENIALLFGSEQSGLNNEEISFSNIILTIKTNPTYGSLNLAQAAGICIYEICHKKQPNISMCEEKYATQKEIIQFSEILIKKLENNGFFKTGDCNDTLQINVRNIFSRCKINTSELKTLYGIFKTTNEES